MKRTLIILVFVGIFLRLFLAFSTFHHDLQPFYFAGKVISEGNIANFYDYLGELSEENAIRKIYPTYLFNYPPAVYFFLGPISYFLALPFEKGLLYDFILNFTNTLGNSGLNWLLLNLKLPFLFFDLLVGLILYRFFDKPQEKLLAFGFWIFNPINLYATYMMGQFDIIPTFFGLLVLYLVRRKKNTSQSSLLPEAILLGLGASFKIYPFLFLIPLALLKKDFFDRLKIVTVGLLTYLSLALPFLGSAGFRQTALLAGQTMKSFYATIAISGGEALILFPLLIIFFYFLFLLRKRNDGQSLWQKFFMLLLLFFVFTHYHPQWFLWLTPFLIIDLVKHPKHWPLIALSMVSFLGLLTFFDPGLTVWLFSPLVPSLYGMPGIWAILGIEVLDINFARSLLQTLFASVGLYYIYYYGFSTPHNSR